MFRASGINLCIVSVLGLVAARAAADESAAPRAFIDGSGPDWKPLTQGDFVNVNWFTFGH